MLEAGNCICAIESASVTRRISFAEPADSKLNYLIPAIVIIVGLYVISSIKILADYERGFIFRLGRLLATAKGPAAILVFGTIDRILRISLRQAALEVPPQAL